MSREIVIGMGDEDDEQADAPLDGGPGAFNPFGPKKAA